MKDKKYVAFKEIPNGEKKTKKIMVTSSEGAILGFIKFWGAWRQYTFHPSEQTLFDTKCLKEIVEEIENMNISIREEWKNRGKK